MFNKIPITNIHSLHNITRSLILLLFITICANRVSAQEPYDILTKLTGSDEFGETVVIDGEFAFVGAPGLQSQAVYIFHFNGSYWEQIQTLDSPSNGNFGKAIDLDGQFAIIGDRLDDGSCPGDNGCNSGAAYIYKYDGVRWNLLKRITPDDSARQNFFGFDVAINDDIVVVSAQYDNNNNLNNNDYRFQGSAYIFQRDAGGIENWGQVAKFKSNELVSERQDEYGRSVDVSIDYVLIGSNNNASGIDQNGSAYVYYRNQNGVDQWGLKTILKPVAVGQEGGNFGLKVAIENDVIVIGDNSSQQEDDQGNLFNGSLSIFHRENTDWNFETRIFQDRLGPFDIDNENIVTIPASFPSDIYIYRFEEGEWSVKSTIESSPDFNISGEVALSDVTLIVGHPDYLTLSGAAYLFEFIATPNEVSASDGKYLNRTVVKWNNRSDKLDGFRIYRDNEEIGSALSVATIYNDYDAIPGKIHTYRVSAYNNTWNESALSQSDLGWMQARGEIQGSVKTEHGAAIDSVEITLTDKSETVGTYLSFDGIDDHVKLPYIPRTRQMSVSAWIRSTANTDQQIVGWGSPGGETIEFKLIPGGILAYAEWNGSDWNPVTSDRSVNDGDWHFVCVVIDEDSCSLYIDGNLEKTSSGFARDITVTTTSIGAYDRVFAVQQFFQGDIDDVRMWDRVRSGEEVQFDMLNSLEGDEVGLIAYWTFDDSIRSGANIAADYRHGSGHHGIIKGAQWQNGERLALKHTFTNSNGEYRIKNFYFEDNNEFRISPYKKKHLFDPEFRDMALDAGIGGSAEFLDSTSFTISGRILYNGTTCAIEGVELFLNDEPTGVFSDTNGEYALAIEEPGLEYTITPVFGDSDLAHTFQPAEVTMVVEDDMDGIDFTDMERQLLYGKVRGGCIAGLGTARLMVRSENNPDCYNTTIITDVNGNYRVFLPAQEYLVDLVAIDNPDSVDILNFLNAEKADLRFKNQNVNFVYHPQPIIHLTVFPDQRTCEVNPVPIMEQAIRYDIQIEVMESYGPDTCFVITGEVKIYDDIGGNPAEPVTLPLKDGKAGYTIVPGVPNILGGGEHPYQKLLQIEANVEGRTELLEQWVLVTGHRPRTPTFASTTPELPLMILRDPPGDRSYSFQAKGSSIVTRSNWAYQESLYGGPFLDLRVGAVVSAPEVAASTTAGAYGIAIYRWQTGGTTEAGRNAGFGGYDETNVFTTSFTANEEFRTSDSDLITGKEGDVFIGASLNQIYALTDIISYDRSLCRVVRDTSLAMDISGFNTTYIYTEDHIKNTVIPQLNQLAILSPDSAVYFESAIEVWQQALDNNERFKKEAVKLRNISLSGGTQYAYSESTSKDSSFTIGYSQIFEYENLVGIGGVIAGVPLEVGYKLQFKWTLRETSLDSTNTQNNSFGYNLGDDDIGDFFSIDVKMDKNGYGTPVFDLVAGTSSCPWEPGTQPRDGVQLGIDTYVQNDVPPDEPATFMLSMGNTSESGETRPYDLRVIQLSNPDGAIIKVGGVPMGNALSYYIPAGDSAYQATVTVERGPRAYDYDNLQIMMVPPCEFDLYDAPAPIADTVTFSVHFASPISDAKLTYPQDNWEINPSEPDSLPVVINDYNTRNDYLKSIKLQYRKPDGIWNTAFDVTKDQLPEESLTRHWNYQNLPDGDYELRVVSDGGSNGERYSPVAKGHIERNALLVRGVPEPADAVLNVGENIAISFAAGINLDNLNVQRDISLMDAADSTQVDFGIVVQGNRLIIQPEIPFTELGERNLIATVSNITDADGNRLRQSVSWRFSVSQQTLYWKSFASEIRTYQGNEEIRTAVLYNSGLTSADYQVVYLPDWLSISIEDHSGVLAPGAEKQITFRANDNIPMGIVRDSITVRLAGHEESRDVLLNILPASPQWSSQQIAAGAYMIEVYTQLLLNEQITEDNLDFVGVFIDDQLRGKGRIRFDELTGQHLAAFQVYYPSAIGGSLEFRLWDASDGREYRYYNNDLVFRTGNSIGTRYNPIIIQPNEIYQTIPINEGWNWISLNVAASDLSLSRILKDFPAQPGDLIKGQYGFSEYSEEGGWTGTLDFLRVEAGYRLKSKNRSEFITAGRPANSWAMPAEIVPGWNWIGYLPEHSLETGDALYFLQNVQGDIIKSHNQSAIYDNGQWVGTLREMTTGQSYALYTQVKSELVYPDLKKQQQFSEKSDWTVDVHKYESNMTVTGAFTFDGSDYGDSSLIVAAFIDGECRGVTRPQYIPHLDRYITFLMIYGVSEEAGESVQLKVYEPNTEITREIEETMVFNSDNHTGSLQEPFQLHALQTEKERIPAVFYLQQNYPNPFNPLTTIEYGLPVGEVVTVTIYDILGQRVSVLVDQRQEAGRYKIQFDAGAIGMASGIYFYQIRTSAFVKSHKMLLLK
jgi:hypothetical protein